MELFIGIGIGMVVGYVLGRAIKIGVKHKREMVGWKAACLAAAITSPVIDLIATEVDAAPVIHACPAHPQQMCIEGGAQVQCDCTCGGGAGSGSGAGSGAANNFTLPMPLQNAPAISPSLTLQSVEGGSPSQSVSPQ